MNTNTCKIAIVGAGAMGSVYAGILGDAGNEVWAIDTWRDHIDAIRANGLRVEGASGDRVVRINATSDPAKVGPCDMVIIATKAKDVAAAAHAIGPLMGPQTLIVSIQNGLGSGERIAEALATRDVLLGVAGGFGASMIGPGHAHHNGWQLLRFGELEGGQSARLERLVQIWNDAGFRAQGYDDIHRMIWEKFICNVCFSGTCTLTGLRVGEVMANEPAWRIASGCALEAYRVARANGIALSFDDPIAYVRDFGSGIPGARPSMLLDHLAQRPSEIDAINGAVPPAAREVGLEAPINEVVSELVRARESSFG